MIRLVGRLSYETEVGLCAARAQDQVLRRVQSSAQTGGGRDVHELFRGIDGHDDVADGGAGRRWEEECQGG